MKSNLFILLLISVLNLVPASADAQGREQLFTVNFYGDTIKIPLNSNYKTPFFTTLSDSSVVAFYNQLCANSFQNVTDSLIAYKGKHQLDDWLYYQLIRSTAEVICPKSSNYTLYTLYKWYLLSRSGYASTLSASNNKLLLYVQSDDEIYNIPCHYLLGRQYVCLNYHDYKNIDFEKEHFVQLNTPLVATNNPFSYKVSRLPDFKAENYSAKNLQFTYFQNEYHFKVMVNNQVARIFNNYPVVNYETYFNIPLSKITYNSLIPLLRKEVKHMNQKNGVDYLMRFTRYAFAYETDTDNFGAEKRLSPEQTLLYDNSDCEDRAALFFFLVRELYNVPMIVLSYPEHVTIAVEFDKPMRNPITYNGVNYWVCEPTPQKKDLQIGESLSGLRKTPYEVVYAYNPRSSGLK